MRSNCPVSFLESGMRKNLKQIDAYLRREQILLSEETSASRPDGIRKNRDLPISGYTSSDIFAEKEVRLC